METSIKAKWCY